MFAEPADPADEGSPVPQYTPEQQQVHYKAPLGDIWQKFDSVSGEIDAEAEAQAKAIASTATKAAAPAAQAAAPAAQAAAPAAQVAAPVPPGV